MRGSAKTIVIDRGAKRIREQFANFKSEVTIGLHKDAKYPDGTQAAQVGFWHEYGTRILPKRAFIKYTLDQNTKKYKDFNAQLLKKVLRSAEVTFMFNEIGTRVREDIKHSINTATSWAAPISERTANLKKSAKVLFDSGTLFRSIGYQITDSAGVKTPVKYGVK